MSSNRGVPEPSVPMSPGALPQQRLELLAASTWEAVGRAVWGERR